MTQLNSAAKLQVTISLRHDKCLEPHPVNDVMQPARQQYITAHARESLHGCIYPPTESAVHEILKKYTVQYPIHIVYKKKHGPFH